MKTIKKILITIIATALLILGMQVASQAASVTVSASPSKVYIGDTITVTVTTSPLGAIMGTLTATGAANGSGSIDMNTTDFANVNGTVLSRTLTFTAISKGTATFKVTDATARDGKNQSVSVDINDYATVTVADKAEEEAAAKAEAERKAEEARQAEEARKKAAAEEEARRQQEQQNQQQSNNQQSSSTPSYVEPTTTPVAETNTTNEVANTIGATNTIENTIANNTTNTTKQDNEIAEVISSVEMVADEGENNPKTLIIIGIVAATVLLISGLLYLYFKGSNKSGRPSGFDDF